MPSSQSRGSSEDQLIMHMAGQETSALVDSVQTWRYKVDARQHGFFLAKKIWGDSFVSSSGGKGAEDDSTRRPTTPGTPSDKFGFTWAIGSLAEYENGFFDTSGAEDCYICFADPSTYPEYPGWMLRNLLVLVRRRWKLDKLQVLCYRDVHARRDDAKSIILSLELGDGPSVASSVKDLSTSSGMPKVTGWERNYTGKVMSRIANLGEYMDPQRYDLELF